MKVLPGIDVLIAEQGELLRGRRVGLVSNASGVTQELTPSATALQQTRKVQLKALFGPEHGYYGAVPDGSSISTTSDRSTGLPVYSLYGQDLRPTAAMLDGLDLLLFDLQSVGVRFYTYTTTLLYVLQAAAAHDISVIVCDRPNPIDGVSVEGPLVEPMFESFIGCGPLPIRHGLTMGELARLYVEGWGINADLSVIPCAGWRRDMWFDDTGLLWVPPSPAMPKPDTTVLYPGTCLIEGTNLSEGRGTALPFEVAGAPWIDGWILGEAMNALELPGIKFRPVSFIPTDNKYQDQICAGVQFHVTDRRALRPVAMGLHFIATVRAYYPELFAWKLPHFDCLMGTDRVRQQIEAAVPVEEIVAEWEEASAPFLRQRKEVLLYD